MRLLHFLILFAFTSCNGQHQTTLQFYNKSSHPIDSIVIQGNKLVKLGELKAGESVFHKFSDIEINSGREGQFTFKVYTQGKVFPGAWGFHDFGVLALNKEEFYIYDNGFGYKDKPGLKPTAFMLYFYNASDKPIDTIFSKNNSIIKIYEASPRSFHVTYDYNKIQDDPEFIFQSGGRLYSKKLTYHDFDNWNDTQTFLHFEQDTISTDPLPWRKPLEFLVDLQIRIPVSMDSITIESSAMTKVYRDEKQKEIRIVFDYKQFKLNPIFKVTAGGQRFEGNLKNHDFENIYYHQKIMYLEPAGIRSLTTD